MHFPEDWCCATDTWLAKALHPDHSNIASKSQISDMAMSLSVSAFLRGSLLLGLLSWQTADARALSATPLDLPVDLTGPSLRATVITPDASYQPLMRAPVTVAPPSACIPS